MRLISVILFTVCAAQGAVPPGMALVPEGRYVPAFRAAKGPREIEMPAFYLDLFPVTNAEYLDFVRANPKWCRSSVKTTLADTNYLKVWARDFELGPAILSNAPVTYVSLYAARAYSAWKGKRLPTIAEWEYAARPSPTRIDGENDPEFKRDILNWYSKPSPETLPAVGTGRANYYGLYDLHSVIWEWVDDFGRAIMTADSRGDRGSEQERFCGGAAEGATDRSDYPAFMRFAVRSSLKANYTIHNLGFRCARDL